MNGRSAYSSEDLTTVYRGSSCGWGEAEYEALKPERQEAARKRLESRKVWRDYMNSADSGVIDDAETQGTIYKASGTGAAAQHGADAL